MKSVNYCVFILFTLVILGCSSQDTSYSKRTAPMPLAADLRPEQDAEGTQNLGQMDGNASEPGNMVEVELLSPEAQEGKKIFNAQGCQACHFQGTGMALKPYPTKPHQASIDYATFEECILKGRPGTAMVAHEDRLKKDEIKKIREYILSYKGK